jgi:hypothetical protein
LLDFLQQRQALETSDNPIAAVVLADLEAKETRKNPADRKSRKLQIAKRLLRRNWPADDIRELLRLVDWLMSLPEDLDDKFQTELYEIEEGETVPFVTSFERAGIKKGLREGLLVGIEAILEVKFGLAGRKLMPLTGPLDADELKKLTRFLKKAKTLDEVRDYLS